MPAEWEPHAATWVAWPHAETTWPGCLADAEREFETLVRALARSERVELIAQTESHAELLTARLAELVRAGSVRLHLIRTDDVWLRDIGPTFVRDGARALVAIDWTFNAWGGKYAPWDRDDAVAARIASLCGVTRERPELVVEGGALEVDGDGTLLATEPTLLDPKRNPGISRESLEATTPTDTSTTWRASSRPAWWCARASPTRATRTTSRSRHAAPRCARRRTRADARCR